MNRHEWYTPNAVVEAAREAMGAIDLDPASCAEANEIVRAGAFYSRADNALARPWYGKVWLNPPFGRHAPLFVARLSAAYAAGEIEQACLLLPQNSLCTAWFAACDIGGLMCMPLRRIQFRRAEALRDLARRTTAKFASVVIGMGVDRERFHSAFAPLGRIAAL